MADKEKDLKIEYDHVTLESDPKKFCKMICAEALTHQQTLRDINVKNRAFYEGNDEQLEKRAANREVERSCLFVNELKPAIDTRISGVMTKLEELQEPIVARPKKQDPTPAEKEQAKWIGLQLSQQLRDCGYLNEVFEEQITAAEIYRSPSAVKVDWEEYVEDEPVVIRPSWPERALAIATRSPVPEDRVEFRQVRKGRPTVQWIESDEFLYEPQCSNLDRDCGYAIHATYLKYHDIVSYAKQFDWDMKKIQIFKGECDAQDKAGEADTSTRDELQKERDVSMERGYRDGKMLLAEIYISVYSDDGAEKTRKIVFLGDKFIVKDEIQPMRGIKYPFEIARCNPLPGTLENFSSVDLGMQMSKFLNEVYNAWIDWTSYSAFPPMKADANAQFKSPPKFGLGQIWWLTDKDAIEPAIPARNAAPDLTALIQAISSRLREILNAHDIDQGFNSSQYEKATSTRLRAAGAAKRFVPTNKKYGLALIGVADKVLKMDQQFHPEAEKFVMDGGVQLDVPSLTNITDPERVKEEELVLLAQMLQNPLYQSPNGMRMIATQMRDVVRAIKEKHANVDSYVPTEDQLNEQIGIEAEMQSAQMDKQNAVEQLSISQSMMPQNG